MVADLKLDLLRREFARKAFNPNQPRVPGGIPGGGQWTSGEGGLAQTSPNRFEQMATAADQPPRSDLSQLQDIANNPVIRARIDEAWNASSPHMRSPQEHGFWISRNETTGELFTRPFTGRGFADSIVPGPAPNDAIAFFHTHPNSADLGGYPGPSRADRNYASRIDLPGLIQSHNGMYYFGASLRSWRPR